MFATLIAEVEQNGASPVLFKQKSLANSIQNKRRGSSGNPHVPKVFSDVIKDFPEELKFATNGDKFLQYIGTVDGDQVGELNFIVIPLLLPHILLIFLCILLLHL